MSLICCPLPVCCCVVISFMVKLVDWGLNKMANILHTKISNTYSWFVFLFWPKFLWRLLLGTICVTLTLDLMAWKWYATYWSPMACINAIYEANPSNNHLAMEWTNLNDLCDLHLSPIDLEMVCETSSSHGFISAFRETNMSPTTLLCRGINSYDYYICAVDTSHLHQQI